MRSFGHLPSRCSERGQLVRAQIEYQDLGAFAAGQCELALIAHPRTVAFVHALAVELYAGAGPMHIGIAIGAERERGPLSTVGAPRANRPCLPVK